MLWDPDEIIRIDMSNKIIQEMLQQRSPDIQDEILNFLEEVSYIISAI